MEIMQNKIGIFEKVLQNYSLPVELTTFRDNDKKSILVKTPHKGIVEIKLSFYVRGFLWTGHEEQKDFDNILMELRNLEDDAKKYLLKNWSAKNKS